MSDLPDAVPRSRRVLLLGLASAIALWLAQPPAGLWPLAWIAPWGWLAISRSVAPLDRGDWLRVYVSGCCYWLLAVHWVRLPHPLTPLGWVLLAAYLGLYPLLFVALTRRGQRLANVPTWISAPVVWTALEWVQAHLFSGFLMGALSHSQADQLWLLQIADQVGAYGVSFLVMMVSTLLWELVAGPRCTRHRVAMPSVALLLLLAAYFYSANVSAVYGPPQKIFRLALIQGDTRATWDPDPNRSRRIMDRQTKLSLEAVERAAAEKRPLDLIVWPESMFRSPVDTFAGRLTPPTEASDDLLGAVRQTRAWLRALTDQLDTPLLLGVDHFDWKIPPNNPSGAPVAKSYNGALLVDRSGEPIALYDKMHRVPFGEYIPFAQGMPALYYLTPMPGGLQPGETPVAMTLGDSVRLSPNICYETVIPHLIRRQVRELTDAGERPDLLVNLTNDAWFWGASELDMHLACAIFRAVETRTPIAIAANGGLSAVVSATGEVIAQSGRMREEVLLVDVSLGGDRGPSPYVALGDWFALGCCGATLLMTLASYVRKSTRLGDEESNLEATKSR